MEVEQETIIIEVNNDEWREGEESSYHEYHVTELECDSKHPHQHHHREDGTAAEMVVEYTEGEGEVVASYTEEVVEGGIHETGGQIVTYENIPARGEIYVNTVQNREVVVHPNTDNHHHTPRNRAHSGATPSFENSHTTYIGDAQDGTSIENMHTYSAEDSDYHGQPQHYQQEQQQQHKVEAATIPPQKQFDYSCPYCPMKYLNKTLLKAHIWVHPQHQPFTCRVCNTSFRNKTELDQHTQRHFNARNFFCRACGASLSCKASCIRHMRKVHGMDDNNIDLFMLKEMASDGKMMLVIRTVRNGKVYKRKFTLMKEQ